MGKQNSLWHSLKEEELLKELEVEPAKGLGPEEVKKRLASEGPNELTSEKKIQPFVIYLRQFKNILIIILLLATALSALAGEVFDAGLIIFIVLLSVTLGFMQEYRAERAIEGLKKMFSSTVKVVRGGQKHEVPSRELVPGDIILIEAGDKVPADARLIEINSLMTDEAALTGESVPVSKTIGVFPPMTAVSERLNMVFTGTTITYGKGRAVVAATGMRTELGNIALEVSAIKTGKTPLELRTEEIGKWLGIIALGICFLVAALGIFRQTLRTGSVDFKFALEMGMFAVALAVAAVPEALAAIVTGTLAIGMHEMAKRNALVRRMSAVETLGAVTVVCSDKTGTITRGEMTVRKLYADVRTFEVSGTGYRPAGSLNPPDAPGRLNLLLQSFVLCNDAHVYEDKDRWLIEGDPTEAALVTLALKAGRDVREMRLRNPRLKEIPFSSERRCMSTLHQREDGRKIAFLKGAPEVVLARCSSIMKNGVVSALSDNEKQELNIANSRMAEDGLRVIASAFKEFSGVPQDPEEMESEIIFLGLAGMMDAPREGAIEAVRVCKEISIKPVMITGDHKLTAIAIAKEVGIYHEGDMVLTGEELGAIAEEEFEAMVDRVSVYARVAPMDKLKIVRAWKKRGAVVAVTGDGVNDAPALKHADIGIAMGITGTEVAKEAADMVLADDNFATILQAIERGRWIYDNIKKYLTYLLRTNLIEVVVLGGIVIVKGPEYLPLLPATILFINLITDGLPALALGIAPPEPDIMKRPPRDPKESFFSTEVRTFISLALFIESPLFFYLFLRNHDLTSARTDLFFLFVFIELVIALNFTSLRFSILSTPPHKWLIISVVVSMVITVLLSLSSSLRGSFGISMPQTKTFLMIVLVGLFITLSIEGVKVLLRKRVNDCVKEREAGRLRKCK